MTGERSSTARPVSAMWAAVSACTDSAAAPGRSIRWRVRPSCGPRRRESPRRSTPASRCASHSSPYGRAPPQWHLQCLDRVLQAGEHTAVDRMPQVTTSISDPQLWPKTISLAKPVSAQRNTAASGRSSSGDWRWPRTGRKNLLIAGTQALPGDQQVGCCGGGHRGVPFPLVVFAEVIGAADEGLVTNITRRRRRAMGAGRPSGPPPCLRNHGDEQFQRSLLVEQQPAWW